MKKFASAVKNIVKTAAESNFVLYAGSWSFFFLLSAVPLVLLLVMACDAFGVDASFLLDEMPAELGEGVKAVFSVAEAASKGATFILVLTSLYSATRLFSYMLKDGETLYGAPRKNGALRKIAGFLLFSLVFLLFLAAAAVIVLGKQIASVFSGKWGTLFGKIALNLLVIAVVYAVIVTLNAFICPRKNKLGAVMLGSLFSLAATVLGSIGFAAYLHFFASYTDLYGNLAAIVVFMLWVYITMLGLAAGNVLIKLALDKAPRINAPAAAVSKKTAAEGKRRGR